MGNRMSNIASPMPQIRAKFTNKLGIPLSGCEVYTYEPNSNILKKTWLNIDKTVENTNPILLDSAGEADIFLDGLYRIVVKDRFGFTVYDVEKTGIAIELDASFVFYNNISQKKINDGFDSIEEMKSINSPQHHLTALVKSFNSDLMFKGGGYFTFVKNDVAQPNDVNIFEGDGGNWHRLNWKNPSIYDAGITGNESDNTAKFQKLVDAASENLLSVNLKKKTISIKELDIPSNMHIYNGTLDTTTTTWANTYGRGAYMFKTTPRAAMDGASYKDYSAEANYVAIALTENVRFVNVHFEAIQTAGMFFKFDGMHFINCSAHWDTKTLFWMIGGLDGTVLINDTPSSYNLIDPKNGHNKNIRIKDCNFNAGYNRSDFSSPFRFNACEDVIIEGGKNNAPLGWFVDTYNKNVRINNADVIVTDPNVVLDRIANTSKPEMLALYVGQNSYDVEVNGGKWKDYGDMGLYAEGASQIRLNRVVSRHSNPSNVAVNAILQPNWRTNTGEFTYMANVADVIFNDCDFVGSRDGVVMQPFNGTQQSLKNIQINGGVIEVATTLVAVGMNGCTDSHINGLRAKGLLSLGANNGINRIKNSSFTNPTNYAMYIGDIAGGLFPLISNTDFTTSTGSVIYNNGGVVKDGRVIGGRILSGDNSTLIENGAAPSNITVENFTNTLLSHFIYTYTLTVASGAKTSFYISDARYKSGWSCTANVINADSVGDLAVRANVLNGSIYVTIENKSGAAINSVPINLALQLFAFASNNYPN